MKKPIILGSKSKARQELMKTITKNYIVKISDIEERIPEDLDSFKIPLYLANLKGDFLKKAYNDFTVIGADTLAFIDNQPVGKPKSKDEAEWFLQKMSNTTQKVITGVAIFYGDKVYSFSETSYLDFIKIKKPVIERYINTNIPYDKAGGIAVEEKGEFSFVKNVRGSFTNVMGLPTKKLKEALEQLHLL